MEIIVVTGMSGAGKSGAINCFEDIGYYCIDNLPPLLIQNFVDLIRRSKWEMERAVFVIDIRGGGFFGDLRDSLNGLSEAKLDYKILFLDASDKVLLRRFSETRRNHPFGGKLTNLEAIRMEREKLSEMKKAADFVINTSNLKPAETNEKIRELFFAGEKADDFKINVVSFGFKYGMPAEADMVFDLRFISNPFYVSGLKHLTGNSETVREYVMKWPESSFFRDTVLALVERISPCYVREGKYHLNIAFGCTGGQHRSVSMAHAFFSELSEKGYNVTLIHRDL
ncbi:MAG: RNase adapter RapZ [Clostridiales Family XIII bacterium]|jgi:UPF0042 nucleotide-binding protein|nr:RNase adapter RapZ [Clostridiales Family XIII bacterium]